MKSHPPEVGTGEFSRRRSLKSSTAVAAGAPFLAGNGFAQESAGQTLRVGLIGCGGRGTGAAAQALAADSIVKLVALGDVFPDRLQGSLDALKLHKDIGRRNPKSPSPE
jgi:hypothetical protein